MTETRELSRRKTTPNFKPLNEIIFEDDGRPTPSYVPMPKFYPNYCSNSNEISIKNLNISYISVPHGSEHTTFQVMRKNQYEDALFKSEDERYECDTYLQQAKQVIKLLDKIINSKNKEQ